jgi:CRP-like cAMP-binding protein
MEPETSSSRIDAAQPHSLSELLECPPAVGALLNGAASCLSYDSGGVVFLQSGNCEGLYVVISGQFLRRTERMQARLLLAPARPGDLVELAAALGDGRHTYTMTAQVPGSVLLLPIAALKTAFQQHPPLRMRLLEELAREVSRAYDACCISRSIKTRRRGAQKATA